MAADGERPGPEQVLEEAAALTDRLGGPSAAEPVRAELRRLNGEAARIVVVGEKKRGKSSLINALLLRPGLLPVDVDVATGVHIAVSHGEDEGAVAVDGEGRRTDIGLERIAEYGALDPVTADMAHPWVNHLEVRIRDGLLARGMELYDTPGVGGLVGGHGAATMAALSYADAVLFVVSGASELTASECGFLRLAADRVATVVFALTQTDKFPGWRGVLERNRRLLAEHAPRFSDAPWFPVSSRLRQDAGHSRRLGDAGTAAAREEASGFPALVGALAGEVAGRARALRLANAAQAALLVLDDLIEKTRLRVRSLVHDPELIASITADRDRLTALAREDARWRARSAQEFQTLERELGRSYQRLVLEYQARAEQRIAQTSADEAEECVRDIQVGAQALWSELETAAKREGDGIALRLAAELAAEGLPALRLPHVRPGGLEGEQFLRGEPRKEGAFSVFERYIPGMGMAFVAGNVLAMASVAVPPLLLIGAGGLLGHGLHRSRRRREEEARLRGDLTQYLRRTVQRLHAEVPAALQDALKEMRDQLEQGLAARMAERRALLESTLKEQSAALEAAEAELAPRREEAKAALAALTELRERLLVTVR